MTDQHELANSNIHFLPYFIEKSSHSLFNIEQTSEQAKGY